MTDLLPPVADGQLVEEKKDIYQPFWQYKKKIEFTPTLFLKFANEKHRSRKGARITFA